MGRQAFDPRAHSILLDASFAGRGRQETHLRMVLDTGASLTVIPWSAAEALGFDPTKSGHRVRFMTGSGMEFGPVVTIKAIGVLGVRVTNVPVLCHDLPQRSLVDGLLGLSFLKHCRLAIDFRGGILE